MGSEAEVQEPRHTWARPDGVERLERDEKRLAQIERAVEGPIVLPEPEADRDLAREPGHLERAAREQLALAELRDGLLHPLRDLVLVEHCAADAHLSAPAREKAEKDQGQEERTGRTPLFRLALGDHGP